MAIERIGMYLIDHVANNGIDVWMDADLARTADERQHYRVIASNGQFTVLTFTGDDYADLPLSDEAEKMLKTCINHVWPHAGL